MQNGKTSGSNPPPGTIDYKWTDIADARDAHDSPPPGLKHDIREQMKFWEQRRRPTLVTDRALTGRSLEWALGLPPLLRPKALCDRFPRIANSISESWLDIDASLGLFDHLLNNRRKGRRGFPSDVQHEIEALCEYRVMLAADSGQV
jgi:hypothetical protein